jgi:hypothetical protein
MNDGKLTVEAIAVLECACDAIDAERTNWAAAKSADASESCRIEKTLAARMTASQARAKAYEMMIDLFDAVDAYRAANKPAE